VGIDVNNCPEKLKHFLFEINEVLEGRGEKIVSQTKELIKGKELNPNEALNFFGQLQNPLNKNRDRGSLLEGKSWNEAENKDKISGNFEKGEKTLSQIFQNFTPKHDSFDLFSEQKKVRGVREVRWDLIIDIQQNKDKWEIRKNVAITYDRYGREKKGDILILKTARLDNRDYNQATGELINQPNKVYRQDYFNDEELAEINAIFAISTSTSQVIRWDLVNNIKQEINEFKIEKVLIPNEKGSYEEEEWIIHSSAERKSDKKGGLIFDSNKMFKVKDLTEAEKVELGLKQESSVSNQVQTTRKNDKDGGGGLGGYGSSVIWGSFTIISLIGLAFTW